MLLEKHCTLWVSSPHRNWCSPLCSVTSPWKSQSLPFRVLNICNGCLDASSLSNNLKNKVDCKMCYGLIKAGIKKTRQLIIPRTQLQRWSMVMSASGYENASSAGTVAYSNPNTNLFWYKICRSVRKLKMKKITFQLDNDPKYKSKLTKIDPRDQSRSKFYKGPARAQIKILSKTPLQKGCVQAITSIWQIWNIFKRNSGIKLLY